MTARGNLQYVYLRNKDGTLKEEGSKVVKSIAKIHVLKNFSESDYPTKFYVMDYVFENGFCIEIYFYEDGLSIRHFSDKKEDEIGWTRVNGDFSFFNNSIEDESCDIKDNSE